MIARRRILHYEALEPRCLLSSISPAIRATDHASLVSPTVVSASAIVATTAPAHPAAVQTVDPADNNSGSPAYVEHGSGWTTSSLPGYLGNSRYHVGGGSGANTANWTVSGLAPGRYEVLATWSAYNNRATNAPYTIFDGTVAQGTVRVNQQANPSGTQAFGVSWQVLGIFSIASGTATVTLSDNANATVSADAVWIVPAPPVPTVTGISPTTGPTTGGTTVTIAGTNLAGATMVKFGAVSATIVSDTANQIVARCPVESAATVDVTVSNLGGASATSSADKFTYVAPPQSILTVTGVAQNETTPTAANGTEFASVAVFQQATDTFTIVNQGNAPLQLTSARLVAVSGPQAGDFQVTQQPAATIAAGGSTTFAVTFSPQAAGLRAATLTIGSNAPNAPSFAFAINGTALAVPPVLNAAPAPGTRVKMVIPQYAGTNVYNTLYLPTDWKPGGSYPVIVEFAPNDYPAVGVNGTVDDTELGYYESGGKGFIWVTMPCINYTTNPASNAAMWWGNGNEVDPKGVQLTAQYCETALIQVLKNYGGNPAEVFITGFSRGAIATSEIGLATQQMADIWAGFIPDSWEDSSTADLARTAGRPTFLVAGGNGDSGYPTSAAADQYLLSQGFPTQFDVIPNIGHTDTWIQNGSSNADLPVQTQLRQWMAQVIETHPGTYSISGTVTDAQGNPVAGVLIQSGATHWITTDANGNFTLPGLINGARVLTATYGTATVSINLTMSGSNIQGQNFLYTGGADPSLVLRTT